MWSKWEGEKSDVRALSVEIAPKTVFWFVSTEREFCDLGDERVLGNFKIEFYFQISEFFENH